MTNTIKLDADLVSDVTKFGDKEVVQFVLDIERAMCSWDFLLLLLTRLLETTTSMLSDNIGNDYKDRCVNLYSVLKRFRESLKRKIKGFEN